MTDLGARVVATTTLGSDVVAEVASDLGRRPVIVTEPPLIESGLTSAAAGALGADVLPVPSGEPRSGSVAILAAALAAGPGDVVVAIGGGSIIDTAKLAARLVADPEGLPSRLRSAAPFPPGLPVVAIPTTAGAGAEVTRTAVVTHDGRKSWAWEDSLRPERAILAPELTIRLPRSVTVASGSDAFVHAMEAVTGARRDPSVVHHALAALSAIVDALPVAVAEPGDIEARAAMLEASTAAGLAIDVCGTGAGHAVGHALASLVPIPHGLAVMAGMRAALDWSISAAGEAYVPVADVLCPGLGPTALVGVVDRLLAAIGFAQEMARWPLPTAEALATEMTLAEHEPMCGNNARPILDGDHDIVAALTIERWSA